MSDQKTNTPEKENPKQPPMMIPANPMHQIQAQDTLSNIIKWGVAVRSPQAYDLSAPFIVTPNDMKVINLEEHMPIPSRVRKTVDFVEKASFIEYFNRYKDGYNPIVFAMRKRDSLRIECVLDYHVPSHKMEVQEDAEYRTGAVPHWGDHCINLEMRYHDDYQALREMDNKIISQEEFAYFIEENAHLFVDPDAATMMEIAQELKGTRRAEFKAGKRLNNGQISFEHTEEIETRTVRGSIDVPEQLRLICPIYDGYEPVTFSANFRYRLTDGEGIKMGYRLMTKLEERAARERLIADLQSDTGLHIHAVKASDD